MGKIDKRQFTKAEWHRIRNEKRTQKENKRLAVLADATQEPSTYLQTESELPGIAFVVGNGTSRKPISLDALKRVGKVYACNAVYRDFVPDYLIAVDAKMILEIAKAGWQKTNPVWTNPNKAYAAIEGLNYFDPGKGWSSGPTALHLASEHNNNTIYILGFDYTGIKSKLNNVFADTPGYKKSNDNATFHGNWLRQTAIVIQKNPDKRYIRVVLDEGAYLPKELASFKNLQQITVKEFTNIFE